MASSSNIISHSPSQISGLIDSHCHLDFDAFSIDRNSILKRLPSIGVDAVVVPGVSSAQWQKLIQLSSAHPSIFVALGLHPYFLNNHHPDDITALRDALLHNTDVVAVGEIGIDAKVDDVERQEWFFVEQLKLAQQCELPIIVHHRQSHDRIVKYLRSHPVVKGGVIHAFSGSIQQAQQYIELGFKLGVGGTITYERASKTRDVINRVGLTDIVLETDAPDMPLSGRQGIRNSPEYLPDVFEALCELRSESKVDIARQVRQNTIDVFNLSLTASR